MTNSPLDLHIIDAKNSVGTVIWMHGLGADYRDFDSLVPSLCFNDKLPIRFIFPNAPIRAVSINHNMPTRAWYDIYSLTDLNREDLPGIRASRAAITQLIEDEIQRGVPANRIIVAGFSQGGAMALHTGLNQIKSIGGIMGLSCYLPLLEKHVDHIHSSNLQTPVFIAHGTHDATLPCFAGKMSYDVVRQTHSNTQWREYPMGHEITSEEIDDIRHWFAKIFA